MTRAVRLTPRCVSLLTTVTLGAVLLSGSAADAALRPGPPARSGGQPTNYNYTPLGETVFSCGTYKGNESQNAQMKALHLSNQQEMQQTPQAQPAFHDYVNDEVWIIEDDGSLTLSGTNAFDTDVHTYRYLNNGGGVYDLSSVAFSYDATVGTLISPGDDGAVLVTLPFSFPFAGSSFTQMYISGNGAVSFGAAVNPNGFYDSADFFSATPKIAAYYLDLDASSGGSVRFRSEATKYTVTWSGVPEYGTATTNTFQLVLFPTGDFTITYNAIGSTTQGNGSPIITGFHPGGAGPALEEVSLSSGLPHVSAAGAAVYEQYFSYPTPLVDEVALYNRFYQEFPDDFFQIVFFTNFTQDMGGAFAYERNIKNDVTGIGLSIFDASSQYGSNGVLESLCNMNALAAWPSPDPTARVFGKGNSYLTIMGQESGHRWGAFVNFDKGSGPSNLILGRQDAHWSYYVDVDHSSLEGGDWVSTGGSNYTCPTNIDYFSELDEYLFGLRTPNEVKDFFYISSASNNTPNARSVGTPLINANATGTKVDVTVEHVIAAEGARTPVEADENHDLRQGFIFLIAQGTTPSAPDLLKIANFRKAWESYFELSCDGRLTCNTSLTQTYEAGVICGFARNRLTQQVLPEFTARSLERGFSQHVPGDGRFIFRYLDGPTQGASEPVTLVFTAPGYLPDTLMTTATYGTTTKFTGLEVLLTPIYTAAGDVKFPTELYANQPNPFNPTTTIRYELGQAGLVRMNVYDAAGHHVRTLVDRTESAGDHRVVFDGRDKRGQALASGVYLYRLDAGNVTRTRKMVLLK